MKNQNQNGEDEGPITMLVYSLVLGVLFYPLVAKSLEKPAEIEKESGPIIIQSYRSPEQLMMEEAGIYRGDWKDADFIITRESDWRHDVWNYEGSGAYGLCQTMLNTHGVNNEVFKNDPIVQLKWCDNYAKVRYGGWEQAREFWEINRWW